MAESEEELKSPLMKVKEESEKVGLKLSIQKTKIMASGPITSWEIDGETVPDFIFLGSKITADGDCSHEIKWCLLLGRKVMTNLDSILKSRDITLPTKVPLVKAMVFPVFMYGCESWNVKKAERRKIDAFELWCWRRLLRVPWTARRSNQSILKEISSGCSLEGLMLKLELQYLATSCKELTHWKRPWCWEGLRAGGEGDDRGWVGWLASLTRWTWVWVNSRSWWWTGRPGMLRFMGSQRIGQDWVTELVWTEHNLTLFKAINTAKVNKSMKFAIRDIVEWGFCCYCFHISWSSHYETTRVKFLVLDWGIVLLSLFYECCKSCCWFFSFLFLGF